MRAGICDTSKLRAGRPIEDGAWRIGRFPRYPRKVIGIPCTLYNPRRVDVRNNKVRDLIRLWFARTLSSGSASVMKTLEVGCASPDFPPAYVVG
jgi:hypothetical protein